MDKLAISEKEHDLYSSTIKDFMEKSCWVIPNNFKIKFPKISRDIVATSIRPADSDKLIWSHSSDGKVSVKELFRAYSNDFPQCSWGSRIWTSFIRPRRSFLSWKTCYRGLQSKGIHLAFMCYLCCSNSEIVCHLFWDCPYVSFLC